MDIPEEKLEWLRGVGISAKDILMLRLELDKKGKEAEGLAFKEKKQGDSTTMDQVANILVAALAPLVEVMRRNSEMIEALQKRDKQRRDYPGATPIYWVDELLEKHSSNGASKEADADFDIMDSINLGFDLDGLDA